jgi:hypothetical protein
MLRYGTLFRVFSPVQLVCLLLHLHYYYYYALSSGYLNWFLSYLTNIQSRVRYSGTLSSPFAIQSGVFQWVNFRAFVFSTFYK